MRSKGALEILSNIVVIVVGLALAVMIGRNLWLSRDTSVHLVIGHKMQNLGDYDWTKHSQTLVIAVRNGCPYCNASKPFYSSLLDKRDAGLLGADILFLHLQSKETADREWSSYENRATFIYKVPLPKIGISGTPTLVLVNHAGNIKDVWFGELDKDSEKDVLAKVAVAIRSGE